MNNRFDEIAKAEGSALKRVPLVMPMAAVLTGGLLLSMTHLVSAEFVPQETTETSHFEINPVEKIIEVDPVMVEPEPYETVETPPSPPTTGVDSADRVTEPVIRLASTKPVFTLPPMDMGPATINTPDVDAQPVLRIPPIMPTRFQQGNVSGFCEMAFNVSPDGQPYDVMAVHCTNSILARPSKKAVLQWKYNPKIRDGVTVSRQGVQTKIRFDLADENGRKLPLPAGY